MSHEENSEKPIDNSVDIIVEEARVQRLGVSSEDISQSECGTRLDRNLLWKLDLSLLSLTSLFFLLAFVDKANVGNARVAGLQTALGISDGQYQVALTVTYIPYIVVELPANLLLRYIGLRKLLAGLCTGFGFVTVMQCLVKNYAGLIVCRFFLGFFEGGVLPGIVLYLSGFYCRHELQTRVGFFFSAVSLSGAFSGLLAAAIQQMNGLGGLSGWQWIFCLEGLLSIIFGIALFFVLPDNMKQVHLLNQEEAIHGIKRLELDMVLQKDEVISLKTVLSSVRDVHVIGLCLFAFCSGACLYGLAYFTPSIVQAFGYSSTKTQLLTVPPFVVGFIMTMVSAYLADHFKQRGITATATAALALIGVLMLLVGKSITVRYTALFFLISGVYATVPSQISWTSNNTAGHVRRATAIAVMFMSANVGGIVSTWMYPRSTAPFYRQASIFNLVLIIIMLILLPSLVIWFVKLNKEKSERPGKVLGELSSKPLNEQIKILGDHHPQYRYTY